MSREVGRVDTSRAVGRPAAAPVNNGAVSTADLAWTGKVLVWADARAAGAPALPTDALAHDVRPRTGIRKGAKSGQLVQVRIAWFADARGITVCRLEQTVTKRADGRYSPGGSWALAKTERFEGVPQATKATIRPDLMTTQGGGESAGPAIHRDFEEATRAADFLPRSVIRGVEELVPGPSVYSAYLVHIEHPAVHKERIRLLRLGVSCAVVITADRQGKTKDLSGEPWDIVQYRYDIAAGRVQIGVR